MEAKPSDKIAIFDSGMGGISFLKEITKLLPGESYIYYSDLKFAPYGDRNPLWIRERLCQVVEILLAKDIKALVLACNTATGAAASYLREKYRHLNILGMEPAIQLAVKEKANKIIVIATTVTVESLNTKELIRKNQESAEIIALACPGLMEMVEDQDYLAAKVYLREVLQPYLTGADWKHTRLVLGCTHYIFLKEIIQEIFPELKTCDGNLGTAKFLQKTLKAQKLLGDNQGATAIEFACSYPDLADQKNFQKKAAIFYEK